ncbi:putative T7SS-secreted protein [Glutamicibacter sp.]|uniref:NfeD family protein n=1 Tax=Glutamicibacter sp. TaxID=1931995 RepID=UPI0028BE4027|nr:hypothetical protein [Glutamicibacter sp.]
MTLQSPETGETLELIEGNAGDIHQHGVNLITSGEAMDRAANRLEDISSGTSDLKSEAITKVRESAEEVFPELRKAAIRYNLTGEALKTYASALEDVQGIFPLCTARGGIDNYASLSTLISDIEEANTNAISKRNSEDEANDLVSEHDGFLGMGEGTDEQKKDAADGLKKATKAREDAEDELDELWGKFDARVSYWEDAYDNAVSSIEDAFEAADNNDTFLSTLTDILTVVGLVLAIAAIVITSPVSIWFALAAVAVSVISLAIEIGKFMVGDGDWGDLTFAIIGLIPFGRVVGKVFSGIGKGSKGLKGFFKAMGKSPTKQSKGIVRSSVKSTAKRPKKARIKGNAHQRRNARVANRAKQGKYRQSHSKLKDKYISGFDESFSKSRWKMTVSYVLENDAAKQRALAEYVLENPRGLSKQAEAWAKSVQAEANQEALVSLYYSMGLIVVSKSIDMGQELMENLTEPSKSK